MPLDLHGDNARRAFLIQKWNALNNDAVKPLLRDRSLTPAERADLAAREITYHVIQWIPLYSTTEGA